MTPSEEDGELRPAYRTLNDPTRLLGISLGAWLGLAIAGGGGYGWLLISPLGWRASVSVAVIGLGAPACLLILREQSTVSPGRLLVAVLRWRTRASLIVTPSDSRPVRRGGVRLDTAAPACTAETDPLAARVWPEPEGEWSR